MASSSRASDARRIGVALLIAFALHAILFTLLHVRRGSPPKVSPAPVVATPFETTEVATVAEAAAPLAPAPATPVAKRVSRAVAPLEEPVAARADEPAVAAPASEGSGHGATADPARVAGNASARGAAALAGPGAAARGRAALLAQILERVRDARRYPEAARRREIEGTVHVRFAVGADGRPQGIATNNGDPLLQAAAKEALERAAPLPVVDGPVDLDIDYRLSE